MQRLIDVEPVIEKLEQEQGKIRDAFNETSVFKAPNDVALYGAIMQEVGAIIGMLKEAPAVTAADLGINEWCTDCKEYDQEKHCCHRFGRVIRQTQEEYLEQIPRWIPVSKRLPEPLEEVLVTSKYGHVYTSRIVHGEFEYGGEVIAWMQLPKPYEVENDKAD